MAVAAYPPEVLDSAGVAKLLSCSVDTVLGLDLPWFPVGGGRKKPHRRYLRVSVLEWCRRRQAAS